MIGCGGFIGSHLLERLLSEGHSVAGWDLDSSRISHLISHPHFQFICGDYIPLVEEIAQKNAVVIHLAALCNPSLYNTIDEMVIQSNFQHAAKLADACASAGSHLLYFSTSEVYGRTAPGMEELPLQEDTSPLMLGSTRARRWSYSCAKQLMERYLIALEHSRGLAWTAIRPFNFIGPRMDFIPGVDGEGIPRVLACFMDAWLHQKALQLVDGGKNLRAFTWIGDAVDAVMLMIHRLPELRGQCLNIGNPRNEVSIANLASLIQNLSKEWSASIPLPRTEIVSSLSFYGPGYEDSERRMPDITKARKLLNWEPKVNLKDALRETMAWYLSHYGVQQ